MSLLVLYEFLSQRGAPTKSHVASVGEEGRPAAKAALGWWGLRDVWAPNPGKGEESGRGREDLLLPKKEEAVEVRKQVELLEKSMELEKATERLKGSGAS